MGVADEAHVVAQHVVPVDIRAVTLVLLWIWLKSISGMTNSANVLRIQLKKLSL